MEAMYVIGEADQDGRFPVTNFNALDRWAIHDLLVCWWWSNDDAYNDDDDDDDANLMICGGRSVAARVRGVGTARWLLVTAPRVQSDPASRARRGPIPD